MKNPIRHGKRWMSFLLVLMLTVGLVAAPAFAASETIENPNGEWESLWNPYFGQVFTPTQNTTVTGASFVIRSCWPHPSSDVTLVITTMNGAILDTSDTVTVGSEYSWVDFTFAGGVRLNAGTSYIVATLSATRGLDARYSAWFDYMGGYMMVRGGASYGWVPLSPLDLAFRVYNVTQYSVTFKDWDGSTLTTVSVVPGATAAAPAAPTRYGYHFTGWDKPLTNVQSDMTVTAQYRPGIYTLSFNSNGGTPVASITAPFDSILTTPADPTREGHTFAGWLPGFPVKMPGQDTTLSAQWTVNDYTLTFDSKGGTPVAPITAAFGSDVTAPADPTKEGHTFAGWSSPVPTTMPAENRTLNAQWTVNDYTLTFDSNGGTPVAPITAAFGSDVNAPADPTKEGHTFVGWDSPVPASMPAENCTLTAQWTVNDYTLTFDSNGGTPVAPITAAYGSDVTAPADPTLEGYSFAGWSSPIPTSMPAENRTLTAQWTVRTDITYTVNYLELGTNAILAPAMTVDSQTFGATVTEQAIEIDGYDTVAPTIAAITLDVDGNGFTFYYIAESEDIPQAPVTPVVTPPVTNPTVPTAPTTPAVTPVVLPVEPLPTTGEGAHPLLIAGAALLMAGAAGTVILILRRRQEEQAQEK